MSKNGIPLIDIRPGYEPIAEELESAVVEVMRSGRYILGPKVQEAEEMVAEYCGVPFAVGVASGTDALIIALRALNLEKGSKVITTPFSFIATAECITEAGCQPVFCDIDPATYNLDPETVRARLEDDASIKAIIPVHLYGQAADMQAFKDLAATYDLKIVEDAAQAFGARCEVDGSIKVVGSVGDFGGISFFPTKNLSTCGDGGMVVCGDEALVKMVRILRAHGANPKYHHSMLGYNSRLDALHAAVVMVKLKYLDNWLDMRRQRAEVYKRLFHEALDEKLPVADAGSMQIMLKFSDADSFLVLPAQGQGRWHTYNSFNILVPRRDQLQKHLNDNGISSMIYYPIPLHLQQVYKPLGYELGDMPVAEWTAKHVLAIPFYPEIPDADMERVVSVIGDFLSS